MRQENRTDGLSLTVTTRALCHAFYRRFESDEALFMNMRLFQPYVYRADWVDGRFDAHQREDRVELMLLLNGEPIGELSLKHIDRAAGSCELSIHLVNDSVKGKGYGTRGERMALSYAFEVLGLHTVYADAVLKNARSQHVFEKAGFHFVREEGIFCYYVCTREDWADNG